jgi:hypothetical protein
MIAGLLAFSIADAVSRSACWLTYLQVRGSTVWQSFGRLLPRLLLGHVRRRDLERYVLRLYRHVWRQQPKSERMEVRYSSPHILTC